MLQPRLALCSASDRLSGDHGVERGAKVAAGDGNLIARATVIELAAIHELAIWS